MRQTTEGAPERLLTADEVVQMSRAGVFAELERIEQDARLRRRRSSRLRGGPPPPEVLVHGGPSPEGYRTKWVVGESGEREPPGAGGVLRVAGELPPT